MLLFCVYSKIKPNFKMKDTFYLKWVLENRSNKIILFQDLKYNKKICSFLDRVNAHQCELLIIVFILTWRFWHSVWKYSFSAQKLRRVHCIYFVKYGLLVAVLSFQKKYISARKYTFGYYLHDFDYISYRKFSLLDRIKLDDSSLY